MLGFIILSGAMLLTGPSKILGMPSESAPLMMVGLAIIGLGAAFTVIPVIPEMLDATKNDFQDQMAELNDVISGVFNMALGLGQIAGPTLAGTLYDNLDFNWTCDIFAGILLGFCLIYMIF